MGAALKSLPCSRTGGGSEAMSMAVPSSSNCAGTAVTDLGGLPPDAQARKVAAQLQAQHPRWLIIWSPWRQQLTAFGRFAPVPIIIDEANPSELLKAMQAEELRFARP
jgi:hypothetical protein